MGLSSLARRSGVGLLTGALALGGVVLGTGVAAASVAQTIDRTTWSSVDLASPTKTITGNGDARIGAWFDAHHKLHVTKAYFTVDLSAFQGKRILMVEAFAEETAADCTKDRATQLWVTGPATAPTWVHQPKERTRLPGPGAVGCPSGWVEWDAGDAVRDALAAGKTKLTLGMTMPTNRLYNPAYSRSYSNDLQLTVTYDTPPNVPTDLEVGQFAPQACGDSAIYGSRSDAGLRATVSDPDGDNLSAEFAVWPVDHPDQAYDVTNGFTSSGNPVSVGLPSDFLVDGETYEWHVRALDDTDASAWSPTCRFSIDDTAPATAPTITSTDYPSEGEGGGAGVPGQFTFDANGDTDIVGFYYGLQEFPTDFVAADHPGGTATVTITPGRDGPQRLTAVGVDVAHNRGPSAVYSFWVKMIAPVVDCPIGRAVNQPITCTFTPNLDGVVSYTYKLGDDDPVTIPAQPDGSATVVLVPRQNRFTPLIVTSTTADGRSATANERLVVIAPTVTVQAITINPVVDQPMSVKASPGLAGTATYTCRLDDAEPSTATADADGSAVLTVVPTTTGWHTVYITGATTENYQTAETTYDFYVPEP